MLKFLIIWSLLMGDVFVADFLGGDQLGYDTFWESDHLALRPYETDVLTPDVQARDVVSDYLA